MLSESSIHVVSKARISFFLTSDYCFIVCVYHIFFIIHRFDRHIDCYCILAIVNNAVINKQVQVSFWYPGFIFFGCIPRRGLCRSYSSFIFNFLRDFHTIFLVAEAIYRNINSAQAFLLLQILTSTCLLLSFWWQPFWLMRSALIMVLICISLKINSVEHLFMYLLVSCMSSLGNVCSVPLPTFWLDYFCCWGVWFLYFGCWPLFWCIAVPVSEHRLRCVLLPFVRAEAVRVGVVLLAHCCSCSLCSWWHVQNWSPGPMSRKCLLMFSSRL